MATKVKTEEWWLSLRSQPFHEVERQLEQLKMIAKKPVELKIIEEIEWAQKERDRMLRELPSRDELLKEGIPSR